MAENQTMTPEQVQALLALLKGGGTTSPSISAPATQQWILAQTGDKGPPDMSGVPGYPTAPAPAGYAWFPNPSYTPPKPTAPPQPTAYGSADTGWYIQDPSSPSGVKLIVPAKTPNADEEIKKALDREQAEQLRLQRQRNEAAGFGYADDDTVAKRSIEARNANLDEKKYAQSKAMDDEKIRQFDIQQAAKDKVDAANIGLTTAQTAGAQATTQRTGAETQQILQNIDIQKAKLPSDLAQAAATLAGTQASTAATQQATQIAGAPTVQTPPTGMYQWSRDPKTGAITQTGINPEYQAKTQADVMARIGQIHSLMQAKSDEVQRKVDAKQLTPEQGLAEFNQWYDQNVSPQAGALQAAQQAAQFKQAQDEAAMRATAYSNALAAGSQARENWTANNANRVGPGWQAANEAASRGDFKALGAVPNSVTYRAPDVSQVANNAVNDALKYLSPTAAAATGTPLPNFQNVDITQQLSSAPYVSRFGPAAPPPVPPAPEAVPPMTPSPPDLLPPGVAGTAADPRFTGMYGPPPYAFGGGF